MMRYQRAAFSAYHSDAHEVESVSIGGRLRCELGNGGEFESGFSIQFSTEKLCVTLNCRDFRGMRVTNGTSESLSKEEKRHVMEAIREVRNAIVQHNLAAPMRRTLEMLAILQYVGGFYSDQF